MDLPGMIRERNEALRSLDEARIRAYMKACGISAPAAPEAFWLGVHKAIEACNRFTPEERERSRRWLSERGSGPLQAPVDEASE